MKPFLTFISACYLFFGSHFGSVRGIHFEKNPPKHQKVCHLDINWESSPLFNVDNFLPGDATVSKKVTIHNNSISSLPVGIKGWITAPPSNPSFTDQLNLEIKQGLNTVWSGTLTELFQYHGFLQLNHIPANQTKNYTLTVSFLPKSGNAYQEQKIIFSLSFACAAQVPPECRHIANRPDVEYLFGTNQKDTIASKNRPSIIFGFGGDDTLNGNSQEDCLIGGDGNDKLHGNNQDDVLIGGNGIDDLFGGNGTDLCLSGENLKTCELPPSPTPAPKKSKR